jgi:pSer/pThr/pTyr-binding forkhead associated (FHA) protein
MNLILKLLTGEVIETTVDSDIVTIGRSPKNSVHVPHEGMSRQHCQIEISNGEIFVTDLNSTNGVFIDGQKIEPNQKVPWQTYLSLSFGTVQSLVLEFDAPQREVKENSAFAKKDEPLTLVKPKTQTLKAAKPKAVEGQVSKKKYWASNILIIAVLAGVAYWYLTRESDSVDYSKVETDKSENIPIPDVSN